MSGTTALNSQRVLIPGKLGKEVILYLLARIPGQGLQSYL